MNRTGKSTSYISVNSSNRDKVDIERKVMLWYQDLPILPYGEIEDRDIQKAFKQILTWKDNGEFISDIVPDKSLTVTEYWLYLGLLTECIEYGASPRGAWLTDFGKEVLRLLEEGVDLSDGIEYDSDEFIEVSHIPKWDDRLDRLLEKYFKEDVEGDSNHRRDYYSDDLPLMDINNYIVNLYHCPPEERWERVTELIPIKWYRKILNILEGQDNEC